MLSPMRAGKWRVPVLVAALALGALPLLTPARPRAAGTPWRTGYYASYTELGVPNMPTSGLDYSALTDVVHWPVVPKNDGTLRPPEDFDMTAAQSAAVIANAHAAGTRVLLGFGGDAFTVGDGWSGGASNANRAALVANMVALMQARGYDGIDINWEELAPADEGKFVALAQALRAALDAINPDLLLTWVPTTGYLPPIAATVAAQGYFDQINLQTYVMSGPYPGWVTWHNSPLDHGNYIFPSTEGLLPSADVEIMRYVNAGVPIGKLGMGIQFDGFVWSGGAGTSTGGVSQPRQEWAGGTPPAMSVMRYASILTMFTPAAGCTKSFDAAARVPWIGCNRAANADDRFISFDDEQAIQEKAQYITQKGMGGVFVFELSGDYRAGQVGDARHPLLTALKAAFAAPPPQPPGPPTNFRATSIAGNLVSFAWDAPAGGTAPTSYAIEGGIAPGDVLASLPTGGAGTTFQLTAPTGAFYVRVHAVAGAVRSAASNEIRIFVNVPAPPAAPASLLGLVSASNLALSWTNTASGGAPAGIMLNVSGAIATSLALPPGEMFSYTGVPPGTYTFTVSAFNGSGSSAASNSVSLTFPGGCSGVPLPPTGFQATKSGNTITVNWSPPASGPAVTLYTLQVTGSFVGSFPTSTRTMAGTVAPGSYTISVAASNQCGASAATTPVTVSIP